MDPYRDQYRPQQSNGLGLAAVITGSFALFMSLIPFIGVISWVLAPIAIILGIVGMKQRDAPRGTAIAGLATGGLALLICFLWLFAFGALVSQMPTDVSGRGGSYRDR